MDSACGEHHAPFLWPGADRSTESSQPHPTPEKSWTGEGGASLLNHQQHLCFAWEVSRSGTSQA
jgi:hypothetical protein